jgi:uncharacterized protein YigA (DUF484 family)
MNGRPEQHPTKINDATVAEWLKQHPDFLLRHPDVLAKINVPHGSGGATSLIERQVSVLREQLANERGRLNHLVARAHDFEALLARLHELTVRLILAPDMHHACTALETALREQFEADAVALKLFPVGADQGSADPVVRGFVEFIDRDRCLCGPLAPEQTEALFGNLAVTIASAALVPIRAQEQAGVLAIGSCDAKRFSAEMGTELLERLGSIAGAKLADLAHRERAGA